MFVSIICDFGNEDHKIAVDDLLTQYGFKKIMNNCYESAKIKEETLLRLKRDIDRATDAFDKMRFFQYPYEETFVISYLSNKRWRKTIVTL
jgi:hypothetical protein